MVIELLGLLDERTAALDAALTEALAITGLTASAEVRRISDPAALVARSVWRSPGLRVDGKVVCRGRVPEADEVRGYLEEARAAGGRLAPATAAEK
jgi:hypothetical protein